MRHAHKSVALQLTNTRGYIGARNRQNFTDFVGTQWLWRQVESRLNLGDRAIRAPACAHLTPMQDVFFNGGTQLHDSSKFSVVTEITEIIVEGQIGCGLMHTPLGA